MPADRPSQAHGSFFIPSLDGMRAVAVLLVFASHAILTVPIPGRFGVTIFFFLSGYLITTLMRREHDRTGIIDFRAFFIRRGFRILPPFLATFLPVVAAMQLGLLFGYVNRGAVLAALFYYANYYMIRMSPEAMPPGSGLLWSLAVEEHFYLIFPFFYFFLCRMLPRRRDQGLALLAVCGAVLAWRCVLVFHLHPANVDRLRIATDTRLDSILFGCALAVWGNPVLDEPSRVSERIWKRVLFPLALITLAASFVVGDDRVRETIRYTIQGIALYPVFAVVIRWPRWGLIRVLSWRPIAFLGTISYSFYLIHLTVITQIEFHGGADLARVFVGLPLSIALSWLVYIAIEKPSARLRNRLMSRKRVSVDLQSSARSD